MLFGELTPLQRLSLLPWLPAPDFAPLAPEEADVLRQARDLAGDFGRFARCAANPVCRAARSRHRGYARMPAAARHLLAAFSCRSARCSPARYCRLPARLAGRRERAEPASRRFFFAPLRRSDGTGAIPCGLSWPARSARHSPAAKPPFVERPCRLPVDAAANTRRRGGTRPACGRSVRHPVVPVRNL